MLNYQLFKEIVCALCNDRVLMTKFAPTLKPEFFTTNVELWLIFDEAKRIFAETKGLPTAGQLIEALLDRKKRDRQVEAAFANVELNSFLEDLLSLRFDPDSIYAAIVKELEQSRALSVLEEVIERVNAGTAVSTEELQSKFWSIATDVESFKEELKHSDFDVTVEELMNQFSDELGGGVCIELGLPILDSYLEGLRSGEVGVIVAPPNRGKTALLTIIARNAILRGYKVLFLTGETKKRDIRRRLWAGLMNVEISQLHAQPAEKVASALSAVQRVGGKFIIEEFTADGNFSPNDLDMMLHRYWRGGFIPDLVVLDYFDLMGPNKSAAKESYRIQLNMIYRDVRRLGDKYNVPIWTASQTNREGAEILLITERVIGEDFQKIANADKIITFNQTPMEYEDGMGRIYVLKTRSSKGKNKVIAVKTDFNRMLMREQRELSFAEHTALLANLGAELRKRSGHQVNDPGQPQTKFQPRSPFKRS